MSVQAPNALSGINPMEEFKRNLVRDPDPDHIWYMLHAMEKSVYFPQNELFKAIRLDYQKRKGIDPQDPFKPTGSE